MTRILVTGGAGFLGSWIANELFRQSHTVLVIDDLSGGNIANLDPSFNTVEKREIEAGCVFKRGEAYFANLDLRQPLNVDRLISQFRPEVLYHLAANAREGASFFQPMSVVSRNTMAYINTLSPAIKYGCKRVILTSSIAVYGSQKPPFAEIIPPRPVDVYGLQKYNMEQLTEQLSDCHNFEYVILRPHNLFGPGQMLSDKFRNVVAIWMNKIMRQEPLTIFGDGQQIRAFSYIEDSLQAFIKAIDCATNQIINIGSDYPIKIIDMAKMVMEAMGVKSYPLELLPDRHNEVKEAFSVHNRARRHLGLKETNLESARIGVSKMAAWALMQGPQEWKTTDKIEIHSDKMPKNWQ